MEIDKLMLGASKLPERYGRGKTLFKGRRNYLKSKMDASRASTDISISSWTLP